MVSWLAEGNWLRMCTLRADSLSSCLISTLDHGDPQKRDKTSSARQASLSITNSRNLLKLMFIELVTPFSHLILCRPLLLLPSVFPSIRVFSNESALPIRWSKYWSSSFSISPSDYTQDWSPLGWTGWISLKSKGLSRVFPTPQFKSINSLVLSFLYSPTLTFIYNHWKKQSLD